MKVIVVPFAIFALLLLTTVVLAICPCKAQNQNENMFIEKQAFPNVTEIGEKETKRICGNGVCEEGESSENCPQDCPPQIVAIPKHEGLGIVGKFILANAPSILIASLIATVLIWFYIKRLK